MDVLSERMLADVHPMLANKIRALDSLYRVQYPNDYLRVEQGLRSWEEQQAIWDKGRDAQGNIINAKLVVTHAPPGHSWHQFGLAVDVCPISLVALPGWSPSSPKWQFVGLTGEGTGLAWGGRWPKPKTDLPHFQMTGSLPDSPNEYVRNSFAQGGIESVWTAAGLHVQGEVDA